MRFITMLSCRSAWRRAVAMGGFIGIASMAAGEWTPPDAATLARLERALASWHSQYNPAEQMVRRPFSSPGYHTTLQGGFVHPTRDSLYYALGLLDTGRPENVERAVAIIRRVVALQDTDPTHNTYGIWSWFLEEPLERMRPPDWNWADFNGVTLLQIARDHRKRLPPEVARRVDAAILHAARAIQKRNVGPSYTNIAIMGTYVTLVAGEFYEHPELRGYGLERLARIHAFTTQNGSFEEYNSPTYTTVALLELSRLKAHVRSLEAQPMIDALLRVAWEEIALHFHPPTRQWSGPHSRAYSSLVSNNVLALIQRATDRRVDFGIEHFDREELRLPVACPAEFEAFFRPLAEPRTVFRTFVRRNGTVGTTYLHPHYALGTINRGDLWNQRRALLLHAGTPEAPAYLRLRCLKNDYDFAAAYLTSAQREGTVVGTVTFATNGGDTHISLAKLKDATFRARDLRLRFEIGGSGAQAARIETSGESATIAVGDLSVAISVVHARLGDASGKVRPGGNAQLKWLDVILHEGEEREFDLRALEEAIAGFVLSVGPHGRPERRVEDGALTIACEGLSVSASVKPKPY